MIISVPFLPQGQSDPNLTSSSGHSQDAPQCILLRGQSAASLLLLLGAQDWPLDPWHLGQKQSRDWPTPPPQMPSGPGAGSAGGVTDLSLPPASVPGPVSLGFAHDDRPILQPHSSVYHFRTALLLSLLLG